MGDGEVILKDSPLHQYLQEIGWDDTETVDTALHNHPPDDKSSTRPSYLVKLREMVPDVVHYLQHSLHYLQHSLQSTRLKDFTQLRALIEPHLLNIHKNFLSELSMYDPPLQTATTNLAPLSRLTLTILVLLLLTLLLVTTNLFITTPVCGVVAWYLYTTTYQPTTPNSIPDYLAAIRRYKQLCKATLSYLRDEQIARTAYAGGVTWSKLDNLEYSSELQCVGLRRVLCSSLERVYRGHRDVVRGWVEQGVLLGELDCVNRYIAYQEEDEHDNKTCSHTLRYHLKLVEHISSELLWRFIVGIPQVTSSVNNVTSSVHPAWRTGRVSVRHLQHMVSDIRALTATINTAEMELSEYYTRQNNRRIETVTLTSTTTSTSTSTATGRSDQRALQQLQLLHSSLNIARIRCTDLHQQMMTSSQTVVTSRPTLELIKLNLDIAQNTLQSLSDSLNEPSSKTAEVPEKVGAAETLQDTPDTEPCPIVPYEQQGNLVYTADTNISEGDSEEWVDSEDELELNLLRHKQDSTLMLAELRHVIETNPTCLYEEDYQEFKKTGLLNPTKQDLKEMYEDGSDDGSDSDPGSDDHIRASRDTARMIGFNPMALSFPGMRGTGGVSLFREMEVCEAYGDLSEEEDEEVEVEEEVEEGNIENVPEK